MHEIESYLERVCGHLAVSAALREHIRDELRGHLLEAVEGHVAAGMAHEAAAARAIEEFGTPEEVAAGLQGIYGRRLVSLLVEKAMQWKEKTMQTGWKWSFVAHAALVLTIAAEIVFVAFAATFIFPRVEHHYHELGLTAPEYWRSIVGILRVLNDVFFVALALLAVGVVIFEWRYRGENKRTLRLAGAGVIAFGLMGLVGAVGFASAVPFAQLSPLRAGENAMRVVRDRAAQADIHYRALEQALARQDVEAARLALARFENAVEFLERWSPAVPVLMAYDRGQEGDKARALLLEVEELARGLSADLPRSATGRESSDIARLREAYGRLTSILPGWPKAEGEAPAPSPDQGK